MLIPPFSLPGSLNIFFSFLASFHIFDTFLFLLFHWLISFAYFSVTFLHDFSASLPYFHWWPYAIISAFIDIYSSFSFFAILIFITPLRWFSLFHFVIIIFTFHISHFSIFHFSLFHFIIFAIISRWCRWCWRHFISSRCHLPLIFFSFLHYATIIAFHDAVSLAFIVYAIFSSFIRHAW